MFDVNTLYQVNKEAKEESLGVKPEERIDLIRAIWRINDDPIYKYSIILLSDASFSLFYATPSQVHCYREYRRLHRLYSSICIDATGGVVKKFRDGKNKKTSEIFLYQIVINFNHTTQSVYQMLSEEHDAYIITFWLQRWLRLNAKAPREVVCDGSRALLNAISLAFNQRSLSEYINICYENAKNGTQIDSITYIRLDTAHFIHAVSRWKCWTSVLHPKIKSFYLYCVALLIESNNCKAFKIILMLILIVCGVNYEDSVIAFGSESITPLEARLELEELIATNKSEDFISAIKQRIETIEFDEEKNESLNRRMNDELNHDTTTITAYMKNLELYLSNVTDTGKNLDSFYKPKFRESLLEKVKEFPLWTKVGIKYTN